MAKRKMSTFERLQRGKWSREQRKELAQKLEAADLTIVHPDAAGIDVGNESHFVAVPAGRDPQPVQEFGSWTADLQRMAAWLKACGIRTVAMQSTGVYWIAVQEVLEQAGLKVFLVNARGTKNLPGRKSDVQECQWLMKLHTYGLLANSFRPPEEIRAVRTIWRQRDRLVQDAGRAIQQIQKALTTMNIRLANAISDVSGVTGLAIIRAILKGERDPRELAKLRHPCIQASEEEVVRSLEGHWRDDVLFELSRWWKAMTSTSGRWRHATRNCKSTWRYCRIAGRKAQPWGRIRGRRGLSSGAGARRSGRARRGERTNQASTCRRNCTALLEWT